MRAEKKIKKSKSTSVSYLKFLNSNLENYLKNTISFTTEKNPVRIEDEAARREKLKNDDIEKDIILKDLTLKCLLIFLSIETLLIFLFSFLQATTFLNFKLEEWSFRLLIGATIMQIYLMLRIAVEYLFPKNK